MNKPWIVEENAHSEHTNISLYLEAPILKLHEVQKKHSSRTDSSGTDSEQKDSDVDAIDIQHVKVNL